MIEIETLRRVDAWVRERVTYKRDSEVWGIPEDWKTPERTLADGTGDCEDFAILAAHRLIAPDNGSPPADPADLFLIACHTKGEPGLNHLLLAAKTDKGLWTCADTADKFRAPAYLLDAYDEGMLRRWMRLSEAENWRLWGVGD